ncbi:MAG: hypothetical protein GYA24_12495 [Candidatus Lokiarchaeota archaeon]|nr:hypothetical protein [Candidatus Lokiarchaeota archaeon]
MPGKFSFHELYHLLSRPGLAFLYFHVLAAIWQHRPAQIDEMKKKKNQPGPSIPGGRVAVDPAFNASP